MITKLNMGIAGTAFATVIAQGFSVILCVFYILYKAKLLIPERESFSIGTAKIGKIYRELISQGFSMALMHTLVSSGTVILQSAINGFGTLIIASHIAARKIFSLTTTVLFTISMASSTFTSQNYGAGKLDRVKNGVKIAVCITTGYSLILLLLSPLIVNPLFKFISGSAHPEVLAYGRQYLYFAFPFFIVLGVLVVLRNALQGLGAKILPLISSLSELLGKILFTIFIIPKMGITGIILCEPLIWCVMTAQLIWAFFKQLRKVAGK